MLKKVTEYEEEKITCVLGSYRNFYQFRIRNYKQIHKKLQANTMLIQMRIRHCYCDTGASRLERSIVLD